MVVSEMGARLSPNTAPLTIAPAMSAGDAPTAVEAGSRTGITAIMAPLDVPVETEIRQLARNPISGRKAALSPRLVIAQIRPFIRPLCLSS